MGTKVFCSGRFCTAGTYWIPMPTPVPVLPSDESDHMHRDEDERNVFDRIIDEVIR
jgi:hypothetical protein